MGVLFYANFAFLMALSLHFGGRFTSAVNPSTAPNRCQRPATAPATGAENILDGADMCEDAPTTAGLTCAASFGPGATLPADAPAAPTTPSGAAGGVRGERQMRDDNCNTNGRADFAALAAECKYTCATCCEDEKYACNNTRGSQREFGWGGMSISNCDKANKAMCGTEGGTPTDDQQLMRYYCPATCGICNARVQRETIEALVRGRSSEDNGGMAPSTAEELLREMLESVNRQNEIISERLPPSNQGAQQEEGTGMDMADNCDKLRRYCDVYYWRSMMEKYCPETCDDYSDSSIDY